jgi:signal transduction histidine kinase
VVTVAALLAVELVALAAFQLATAGPSLLPPPGARALEGLRTEVNGFLGRQPPDLAGLQAWLQTATVPVFSPTDATGRPQLHLYHFPRRDAQTVLILDPQQRLLATTAAGWEARLGEPFDLAALFVLPPDLMTQLASLPARPRLASLLAASPETRFNHDRTPTVFLYPDAGHHRLILVTPLFDDGQVFRGALLVITEAMEAGPFSPGLLAVVLASLVAFTVAAALVGSLFGTTMARGLARRLEALVITTAAWGQGDFSRPIHDASADEIGRLATHLNDLGGQLQGIVDTRQQLATAEERNRLARDLHDSVKQQVFAISLNVSAARRWWDRDPAEARARLEAAEVQAQAAQRELMALIGTLRPVPLDGRDLATALGELVATWETQTGIAIDVEVPAGAELAVETRETLYRVSQEGLANIARHSGASAARLVIAIDGPAVRLELTDNGHGFDPDVPPSGLGLRSMRERVAALGGEWHLASGPQGTRVEVRLTNPGEDAP